MDWKLLFPHLGTVIVVFIGWFVVHLLNAYRDRSNKRREIRVQYLIEAYQNLESAAQRPSLAPGTPLTLQFVICHWRYSASWHEGSNTNGKRVRTENRQRGAWRGRYDSTDVAAKGVTQRIGSGSNQRKTNFSPIHVETTKDRDQISSEARRSA